MTAVLRVADVHSLAALVEAVRAPTKGQASVSEGGREEGEKRGADLSPTRSRRARFLPPPLLLRFPIKILYFETYKI